MSTELWSDVRRLRLEVADRIEALGPERWDAPSWCPGWRVRDVLGHLVHLAEASQASMLRDVLRNGALPHRALSRIARRLGDGGVPDLAQRLRVVADGRFHVIGAPNPVVLGEVLVHAADALRPGDPAFSPAVGPANLAAVLDVYRLVGRVVFHGAAHRGLRLVATDLDWQTGNGLEARGKALDLLLLMANRRQVLTSLEGPGVATMHGPHSRSS